MKNTVFVKKLKYLKTGTKKTFGFAKINRFCAKKAVFSLKNPPSVVIVGGAHI
jgi:hypothetical protein